jgi:signal transduction histidine kinase
VPFTPLRWIRLVRPHDIVWLLLFAAIAFTIETPDFFAMGPLAALAAVQVLEPKIPALASPRGRIFWTSLKLALGFLLIGYTGAIRSPYWLILLLPVVSAATAVGVVGTLAFTLVSAGAYLFYLLYIPQSLVDWGELIVRVAFLAMVGNLANALAEDLRVQTAKYRRTGEQLAEANVQLQHAEEAVRRSDRLAALGQLSAGLAHELRNPLGTIKASAEMLSRTVSGENEVAREVAGFITSEVDRTNSLVTRFLQFARPVRLQPENADLAQVLDRAVAAAEREAPQISIYRNYAPEIPPFPFDAELMERVFFNLVLNAAQATAAGGAVTVKTRAAGGTAEIAVIDRGVGIEPKPQGVGLGLAIVSKIVDEHGGKITVESEPGRGSIFRVFLPMRGEAAEGRDEARA